MKTTLLILTAMLTTTFTSGQANEAAENKTKGHFIVKMGAVMPLNLENNTPVYRGLAYQSKIYNTPVFQSFLIEFSESRYINSSLFEEFRSTEANTTIYLPKISAIAYLNSHAASRFFISMGPHLATITKQRSYMDSNTFRLLRFNTKEEMGDENITVSVDSILGASLGCGIELGKASEAISILKIEYDQPLMKIDDTKTETEILDLGTISLTFALGF